MWKYSILAIVLAATPAMAGDWAADVIARLPVQIAELVKALSHSQLLTIFEPIWLGDEYPTSLLFRLRAAPRAIERDSSA